MPETVRRRRYGYRGATSTAVPAIVSLRPGGDESPLFLIHGVDGTMRPFRRLIAQLDLRQPVYGVLAQAILGEERPLMRLDELAEYYLKGIHALGLHKPYHFLGYSYGGLLAFEMAQQLHARGEPVGMVGMLDNVRMGSLVTPGQGPTIKGTFERRREQIARHLGSFVRDGRREYLRREFRTRFLKAVYTFLYKRGRSIPRPLRRTIDINWFAALGYLPRRYPGRLTLFQASASVAGPRATQGFWAELCDEGVELICIPGTHEDILRLRPNAKILAQAIADQLSKF